MSVGGKIRGWLGKKIPDLPLDGVQSTIPVGVAARYVPISVMAKLSEVPTVQVIDGELVLVVGSVPMPLSTFVILLCEVMSYRAMIDAARLAERHVVALWSKTGLPPTLHEAACREPLWTCRNAVTDMVQRWRAAADPVEAFAEAMQHFDALYAVAVAEAGETGRMAECLLSEGSDAV